MISAAPPRILLVEDDPTTLAFLTVAAQSVGVVVDTASSAAHARTVAGEHRHALWLIDANLPDGRGESLLAQLRARHPHTPAIAHTASSLRADLDALIAAGFREVLVKPLPAQAVASAVRRALGRVEEADAVPYAVADSGKQPVWDDAAATRALGGNPAHVSALRGLFLAELPLARQRVADAGGRGDHDALHDELHKLRASCALVGAARLGAAVLALQRATTGKHLARFDEAAADTLA